MSSTLRSFLLRKLLPILLFTIVATAAMWLGFRLGRRPLPQAAPHLAVTVVNVGAGEATWIRTPRGKFILIGGGPPDAGSAVAASLRTGGAKKIDLLILPYPYAEAIGGVPEVLRRFDLVDMALSPGYPPPGRPALNRYQEDVQRQLDAAGIPVQTARAGQEFYVDGVRIEVLSPGEPLETATPTAANNSIALRVTWGQTSFIYAGGLERAGEKALLSRAPQLSADWLRVGRLGTREATSSELIRLVSPRIVVLSVGPNSGGYPHLETMDRLDASGARILRTDRAQDDMTFESDGVQVTGP